MLQGRAGGAGFEFVSEGLRYFWGRGEYNIVLKFLAQIAVKYVGFGWGKLVQTAKMVFVR